MWARRIACVLGLLALGCDGTTPVPDASVDGGASRSVEAPEPAVLPALTPCPDGWSTVFGAAGAPECDPLPDNPGLCTGGIILPGEGCVPRSPSCPDDGWPTDLPGDAVYVDPAAVAGDGSRAAPLATLEEALSVVAPGGTVALRVGSHAANTRLSTDVTLRGACLDTVLTNDIAPTAATDAVLSAAATVTIEDVTLRGAARAGIFVEAGGDATLRRVAMFGVRGFGVGVLGQLTAEELLIDGVGTGLLGGSRGITVEGEGSATVRRVTIRDTSEVGVFATGMLTMEDAALLGSWDPDIGFVFDSAPGVSAEGGGTVTLRRALLATHTGAGARASGSGSLVFEDVVIRGNREEGIRLASGGAAELTRCTIGPGHPWGVLALDADTQLQADHLLLTGAFVRGISAVNGASLILRHTLVADSTGGGVLVDGTGSSLVAEDLTVRDIEATTDGARGIGIQRGATCDLRRVDVARARGAAIAIFGDGSPHRLEDVTLRETRSTRQEGRGGTGLLTIGEDVEVEVERALLRDNRGTALSADLGVRVSLRDVVIRDTQPHDCAAVSCPDEPGGTGIGVYRGAAVTGSSFVIEGSPLCGVQIASDGQLDLTEGRVSDGLIGACVQVEDFDIRRIEQAVSYVRNDRNLDSAARAIPASQLPDVPREE